MTPIATSSTRPPGSVALAWALAASVALHAGFVVATFGDGRDGGTPAPRSVLQATLQPAQEAVLPSTQIAVASPTANTGEVPAAPVVPAADVVPPAAVAAEPVAAAKPGGVDGMGIVQVIGEPLADRNRLGDLAARELTEFPVEVDRPVRLAEAIVARYPTAALAQGREESVGVWIIVDAQGIVDEIQIMDGSQEFADEVRAAIGAAKFLPAENKLQAIRYPLALEFQFRAGAAATVEANAPR